MLAYFKPTWITKEYQQIRPEFLLKQGIKIVFTDLDNTLIAWDEPHATEQLIEWIKDLKAAGISVVLVSNNNTKRIGKVAQVIDTPFVYPALKPLHKGFKDALKLHHVEKEAVVMIGDQIMTDIFGATTFGIRTILVNPIKPSDGLNTKINRFFERIILKRLKKKNQLKELTLDDE